MKSKLIITLSLILLALALGFMVYDFFRSDKPMQNPYDYNLNNLRKTDSSLLCYEEILQWRPVMEKIRAIAIDQNNFVFVVGKNMLVKYSTKGEKILAFSIKEEARCIAINPEGQILLGMWDHVQIWNEQGELMQTWPKFSERSIITSIAATDNEVFVADYGEKIVYRCNYNGNIINKIGAKDTLNGIKGFFIPSPYFDLALGHHNELWVVNPGYHRIEAYSFSGQLKSAWERTSMQMDGFSGCCNPSNIAILSDGSFVTSEKGIERVKIHDVTGEFNCLVAGPDKFQEGTVGLDISIDQHDRIYILDPKNGLIRVFERR